jgi:hypothetical protein
MSGTYLFIFPMFSGEILATFTFVRIDFLQDDCATNAVVTKEDRRRRMPCCRPRPPGYLPWRAFSTSA